MRHHDPQKAIRLAHMIAKHLMRGGYADGGDPTPDDDADYAAAVAAGQNADLSGATPLTIYGNKPDTSRATVEGADMPPQPAGGNDVVDRALKASAQSMSPAQLAKLWTSPEEYGAESPDWSPLAKDVGSKFMEYTAPRMEDFERGSMGPSQLVQQGIENMRSGEPWRMLAGAGQDVLGTVSQPFAPIAGAMEAAKGSAERTFGPAAGQAVDVASNLNPDFLPTALAKAAHYTPELAMAGMGMKAANPAVDLDLTRGIGWDQNRIDKEINYSHYDDGRSKAMVAFVNPNDFLAATTSSAKVANDIAKEADVLDLNKLSKESQSPFLKVQDGKITNHEGRHRMAAMASAGYDRVPVILDYGKKTALSSSDVLSFKGQHPKSPSIKVQNAIPLNKQYADQISKIMQEKNTHFQRGGSIVDRALNLTRGPQR